jgi:RNA polymerase sigma-70 factor (ECF subfamily)
VGLLALMLLSDARVPAREGDGDLVLLKDQDRSLWDRSLIAERQALVLASMRRRRPGPFQLQAAIQALHCAARTYDETDWASIIRFYDRLVTVMPTPVVALNRAVAVAEIRGAGDGLLLLDELSDELASYHPWHAARGSMLHRLGRRAEAADAYARAADLARTKPTVQFLRKQSESITRGD